MPSILLTTAAQLPKPDPETPLIVEALVRRGFDARLVPWDAPLDWRAADLVVIRSTWDYCDRLEEFLAWADAVEAVTRLANPAVVVRWNTHKRYLLDLAGAGVPTVPTTLVERGGAPTAVLPDGDLVVKPAVGVGAIGALRAPAGDPALAAHLAGLAATGDVLVQPFVPSVAERGEVSLLFAGDELSHAVRKVPAAGDYRVQDHHGGSVVPHTPTAAELEVARAAIAVSPAPCAYARADLVDLDGGPVVMELELVEPALFLDADAGAPDRFAAAFAAAAGD